MFSFLVTDMYYYSTFVNVTNVDIEIIEVTALVSQTSVRWNSAEMWTNHSPLGSSESLGGSLFTTVVMNGSGDGGETGDGGDGGVRGAVIDLAQSSSGGGTRFTRGGSSRRYSSIS